MKYSREKVVDLIESWVGKNEYDGSHKTIIDIYNSQESFPRGTKMQYDWAWCACTWSALAVELKYTEIMPIEISCYYIIERAKEMGCWVEDDSYVPKIGDAVLYDWDDNNVGDNLGTPEHIGVVTYVNEEEGYMTVTEGNYDNSVKKRNLSLNGKFIRGFIAPKYNDDFVEESPQPEEKDIDTLANEVIAGLWGTGKERKKSLKAKGYDYKAVQAKVNEILKATKDEVKPENPTVITPVVTKPTAPKKVKTDCFAQYFNHSFTGTYKSTANLYIRNNAGTDKEALVLIPKNTTVKCYGYYSEHKGSVWFLVQCFFEGVQYTGFTHSGYLVRV